MRKITTGDAVGILIVVVIAGSIFIAGLYHGKRLCEEDAKAVKSVPIDHNTNSHNLTVYKGGATADTTESIRHTPISQMPYYLHTYGGEEVIIPLIGDEENWIVIDVLIEIESGGDPCAISPAGARGLCQIMELTWQECEKLLGLDWFWHNNWYVPAKNRAIGIFYVNNRIPKMLKHYEIPDSVETRLACYNWGIGNVNNVFRKYGHQWERFIPEETSNYIMKYQTLK